MRKVLFPLWARAAPRRLMGRYLNKRIHEETCFSFNEVYLNYSVFVKEQYC